jgi:lipoprotein NlpD
MLLTACGQAPNYAPVKTVNQALEPTNGYYLRNKPAIQPSIEPGIVQQSSNIPVKKQDVSQNPQQPIMNEGSYPEPHRHKPSQSHAAGQPATKETADIPVTSTQKTDDQNQGSQEPAKNKFAKSTDDKSQFSKPQVLARSAQEPIDQSENKSIFSNTNAIDTQKNQGGNITSLDNVQLAGKDNKKSIISIDNKKMLKLNFQWPLLGKISRNFSQTDNKGILIKGKTGQAVHAAEAGKAVYCGQGLPGFGNLAIIKHNATYLSAYANNSKLTIKEGEQVAKGQTIGQVGLTGLKKSSLHFEIRKNGKPINPLIMLPKQ